MRLENSTIERRLDAILVDVRAICTIIAGWKEKPQDSPAQEPQAAAPRGA